MLGQNDPAKVIKVSNVWLDVGFSMHEQQVEVDAGVVFVYS